MLRESRAAPVDGRFPIRFECIRNVVVLKSEEEFQELVRDSVQKEFESWVIHNSSARHETGPKNAVISFVEHIPIPNHVTNIVRSVRHHDNHGIALCSVQAPNDRSPKPVEPGVLGRRKIWETKLQLFQNIPGAVATPIIHDYDFVRHIMKA